MSDADLLPLAAQTQKELEALAKKFMDDPQGVEDKILDYLQAAALTVGAESPQQEPSEALTRLDMIIESARNSDDGVPEIRLPYSLALQIRRELGAERGPSQPPELDKWPEGTVRQDTTGSMKLDRFLDSVKRLERVSKGMPAEPLEGVCPHCHLPAILPEVCTPEIRDVQNEQLSRDGELYSAGYLHGKRMALAYPAPSPPPEKENHDADNRMELGYSRRGVDAPRRGSQLASEVAPSSPSASAGELTYTLHKADGSVYSNSVPMDTEADARRAGKVIDQIQRHVATFYGEDDPACPLPGARCMSTAHFSEPTGRVRCVCIEGHKGLHHNHWPGGRWWNDRAQGGIDDSWEIHPNALVEIEPNIWTTAENAQALTERASARLEAFRFFAFCVVYLAVVGHC